MLERLQVVLFIEPPLHMQLTLEAHNYLEVVISSYNVHEKLAGGQGACSYACSGNL